MYPMQTPKVVVDHPVDKLLIDFDDTNGGVVDKVREAFPQLPLPTTLLLTERQLPGDSFNRKQVFSSPGLVLEFPFYENDWSLPAENFREEGIKLIPAALKAINLRLFGLQQPTAKNWAEIAFKTELEQLYFNPDDVLHFLATGEPSFFGDPTIQVSRGIDQDILDRFIKFGRFADSARTAYLIDQLLNFDKQQVWVVVKTKRAPWDRYP